MVKAIAGKEEMGKLSIYNKSGEVLGILGASSPVRDLGEASHISYFRMFKAEQNLFTSRRDAYASGMGEGSETQMLWTIGHL